MCGLGNIPDVAGGSKPMQSCKQGPWQQSLLLPGWQGLYVAGEIARIFRQNAHTLLKGDKIFFQESPVFDGHDTLVGHNGQGPEHEDKTGLLFIIFDQYIARPLSDIRFVLFQFRGLPCQDGIRLGANQPHIGGMN